jgi:hypothetical protein
MAGAEPLACFAVEIFVEKNEVAPLRVSLKERVVAVNRADPIPAQENV